MACLLETSLSPQDLLDLAQSVERDLGRVPSFRYGPRVIDVDILLYGDEVIETPRLQVPHPRLWQRAFALTPLAEIAPSLAHPILGASIAELLEGVAVSEREGVVMLGSLPL